MLKVVGNPIFSGDSHFGHANIIKYCDRPFKNSMHMDEVMITQWNEQVAPNQLVIHLGDFSFEPMKYVQRLNGKILLVMGNHDHRRSIPLFFNVVDHISLQIGEFNCFLNHRPLIIDEQRRKDPEPNLNMLDCHDFIIHGHVHEKFKVREHKNINIGVDAWGGRLISYDELVRFLRRVCSESIENMEAERWVWC